MKQLKLYVLVLLAALTGCKQNKETLSVDINTADKNWAADYVESGENVRLTLSAKDASFPVNHFILTSYDPVYLQKTLLDTVFTTPIKEFGTYFIYKVPQFADTTSVELTVVAYNTAGDKQQLTLWLDVLPKEVFLRSIDNITMYSAASHKNCAFSLMRMTATDTLTLQGDSLYFADMKLEDETLQSPSLTWYSHVFYFSRFESFDFGEATQLTVTNAYLSSKSNKTVRDIHNDDILLFGTAKEAVGAIKVLSVIDEDGTENDRYIFSIKVIDNVQF